MKSLLFFLITFVQLGSLRADPLITSWYTARSGKYARIYKTVGDEGSQSSSTTWSRGAGVQNPATYSGVSEVLYSATKVYIRTTGLASHVMGPWYLDAAKTMLFPNYPSNTGTIYQFPRVPVVPASKTKTGNGAIGYFVNGVAFFDNRDTFSYSNANHTDATPVNGLGLGDGIWNRNAYANELVTFDAALAHQAGKQYHYHVQPIALRYQLGDHVNYDASTNRYSEPNPDPTPPTSPPPHSPIVAWAQDGFPVYGPFGYADPMDPSHGTRRMRSGYVVRDGNYGTTNLNSTGRHTLPAWAAAVQGQPVNLSANQYGPNVDATTYPLGHYLEDYDYLGDLGYTQGAPAYPDTPVFDLDKYNGRNCVTPVSTGVQYAYFSTLNSDASPAYPYNIGRQFYGTPQGGTVASIGESVTIAFHGGPNKSETWTAAPSVAAGSGDVTLVWSAVEGGSYKIEATPNFTTWTTLSPNVTATTDSAQKTETSAATSNSQRFYRTTRAALAGFDSAGFDYP